MVVWRVCRVVGVLSLFLRMFQPADIEEEMSAEARSSEELRAGEEPATKVHI